MNTVKRYKIWKQIDTEGVKLKHLSCFMFNNSFLKELSKTIKMIVTASFPLLLRYFFTMLTETIQSRSENTEK